MPAGSTYTPIATTTLGSAQASVTFNSFSGYTDIYIVCDTAFASTTNFQMRFNSDTGTNYASHYLRGNGATVTAGGDASLAFGYLGATVNSTTYGSAFVIDILDYASTSKNKTIRALGGVDLNGSGRVSLWSGAYYSTNAIDSIRIFPGVGTNFVSNSHFALYGIKG